MDQSLGEMFKDLERYIKETWTGEENSVLQQDGKKGLGKDPSGWPWEKDSCVELKKGGDGGETASPVSLEALLSEVGGTFHELLFERIRESGMTDVEVYKRANIDRRLFSKIRSNPSYHPRKGTVLAMAVALKLDLKQTEDLLSRAEYALSPASKSDVIIRYFIERGVYDIYTINTALHDHGLPVLE